MLLGSLTGKGILGLVREGSSKQLRPVGRKGLAWEDLGEESVPHQGSSNQRVPRIGSERC